MTEAARRLDPAALATARAAGLRERSRLARAAAAALDRALRRLVTPIAPIAPVQRRGPGRPA